MGTTSRRRRGRVKFDFHTGNHILDTYAPSLLTRFLVPGAATRAKARCIAELDDVYNAVLQKYGKEVSRGDLPPKEVFVAGLEKLSSLNELPRTDEATTIDDVKYWLAESVPRVTEPSDSPEKARPSTAFDDDRYLSREAKRKRAASKSSVGVIPVVAAALVGVVGVGIALGGGDRALVDDVAAQAGEALSGVVAFLSGHAEKAREVVQGLGNASSA